MTSKQLDSILSNTPSATVTAVSEPTPIVKHSSSKEEITKIVARIPKSLKHEIKQYIINNPGETEASLILKGLKKMGFEVDAKWLLDRRTLR